MFDANLRELPNGTEFAATIDLMDRKGMLAAFFKEEQVVYGLKQFTDKPCVVLLTNNPQTPWLVVEYNENDFDNSLVYSHEVPLDIDEKMYLRGMNLMEKTAGSTNTVTSKTAQNGSFVALVGKKVLATSQGGCHYFTTALQAEVFGRQFCRGYQYGVRLDDISNHPILTDNE